MSAHRRDPWQWRALLGREIRLEASTHEVAAEDAAGRILAADLRSPEDVPADPESAMDGFAVRRADLIAPGATMLPVRGDLAARPGEVPALAPGTAARIMTGAPVPAGADAVIEVEATDAGPTGPAPEAITIDLDALPDAGRHIRGTGEETSRDDVLAAAGDRVGAGLLGLARILGIRTLPVRAPLQVTIVVTGDELVADGATDDPGAIRESNGAMLAAALRRDGAIPRILRSGDDPAALRRVLRQAGQGADLVVTTGGIGHGAYDVVKALLGPEGTSTSHFAHLALRPGGPQGYGELDASVPMVHLPGTPVGALVGHHLFVRPLLAGAAIRRAGLDDPEGRLARSRSRPGLVAEPGRLRLDEQGRQRVELLPGRRLAPYGRADAIVLGGAAGAPDDTVDDEGLQALVIPL